MKLQEAIDLVNEEGAGSEELKGKADITNFSLNLKKALINKGFKSDKAGSIVGQFIQQLNTSGWMAKILPDDESTPDVKINIEGSQVRFFVTADENPRETHTFTINGVASPVVRTMPTLEQPKDYNNATTDSFQRAANIAAKAQR